MSNAAQSSVFGKGGGESGLCALAGGGSGSMASGECVLDNH